MFPYSDSRCAILPMFEFQSVRRSFPRNLTENSEAASFLGQTPSYETEVLEREPWDFTNDYENFEKGMIYMKIWKKGG
jgi:hypothetical protein